MGLIGNQFRINTGVHRCIGDVMSRTPGNMSRYSSFCNTRSQEYNTTVYGGTATPIGGYPSATFYPPQIAGEMSFRSFSEGDLSADLYPSKSMEIDLTGSGDFDATAALVISMLLNLTGSGDLDASIVGNLNMAIDLTGSGDLNGAMAGYANMIIDLLGQGDLEATVAAYGNMAIDMVVTGSGLTTSNVGQYVWEAILSQFSSNPDSAAAKLLGASSAGDPWATNLPASYTGTQAGQIMAQIQTLVDELHKIQGLDAANPMTVTPNSRVAGSINLDITGDGETSTTVTRQ